MSKFENFKKSLSRAFNNFSKKITQIVPKKEVYKIEEGTRSATVTSRDWLFFHQHWCTFTNNVDINSPEFIKAAESELSIRLFSDGAEAAKRSAKAFCKKGIIPA